MNIEHSVSIGFGARAIARKDGIEVRREISEVQDEIIAVITWAALDHLRARVFDQR